MVNRKETPDVLSQLLGGDPPPAPPKPDNVKSEPKPEKRSGPKSVTKTVAESAQQRDTTTTETPETETPQQPESKTPPKPRLPLTKQELRDYIDDPLKRKVTLYLTEETKDRIDMAVAESKRRQRIAGNPDSTRNVKQSLVGEVAFRHLLEDYDRRKGNSILARILEFL